MRLMQMQRATLVKIRIKSNIILFLEGSDDNGTS